MIFELMKIYITNDMHKIPQLNFDPQLLILQEIMDVLDRLFL